MRHGRLSSAQRRALEAMELLEKTRSRHVGTTDQRVAGPGKVDLSGKCPHVDVVIPTWSQVCERWLVMSVDSAVHQVGVTPHVHVVMDYDMRNTDMPALLLEYPHVSVYRVVETPDGRNGCAYRLTNALARYFRSDYLMIQDADDWSLPQRAAKLVAMIASGKCDAAGGAMEQTVDVISALDDRCQKLLRDFPIHASGVQWTGSPYKTLIHGSSVISIPVWRELNGYADLISGGDNEFFYRLQAYGKKIAWTSDIVAARRLFHDSLSHSPRHNSMSRDEIWRRYEDAMKRVAETPRERLPDLGCIDRHSEEIMVEQVAGPG